MKKTFIWLTLFAIAMGFLETTVVVYLRALLYPHGFEFPLVAIPPSLAITEILREVATLIMLVGIGIITGRNTTTRFASFLYAFAIWDIFYYVFLKLLLDWPSSWMTHDILFLIPVTWVGPVITPVIVSLTMIGLALLMFYFDAFRLKAILSKLELTGLVIGSIILVLTFSWDYASFISHHYAISALWSIPSGELMSLAHSYIPLNFNWFLFALGEGVILVVIAMYYRRLMKTD